MWRGGGTVLDVTGGLGREGRAPHGRTGLSVRHHVGDTPGGFCDVQSEGQAHGGSGHWDVGGDPFELIILAPEIVIGEGASLWIKLLMYSRLVPQDRFPRVKFL